MCRVRYTGGRPFVPQCHFQPKQMCARLKGQQKVGVHCANDEGVPALLVVGTACSVQATHRINDSMGST